jgi:hypothetical protein
LESDVRTFTGTCWKASAQVCETVRVDRPLEDLKYFRERLQSQRALKRALPIQTAPGVVELAVPAAGKRAGGDVVCLNKTLAENAIEQLKAAPDFPRLRIAPDQDGWRVVWGAALPTGNDARKLGQFFGYTERSIKQYCDERGLLYSRLPVLPSWPRNLRLRVRDHLLAR